MFSVLKHCNTAMSHTGTILARSRNNDGSLIEIESSQWECPTCGTREARPERWRQMGRDGTELRTQMKAVTGHGENGKHRAGARRH